MRQERCVFEVYTFHDDRPVPYGIALRVFTDCIALMILPVGIPTIITSFVIKSSSTVQPYRLLVVLRASTVLYRVCTYLVPEGSYFPLHKITEPAAHARSITVRHST